MLTFIFLKLKTQVNLSNRPISYICGMRVILSHVTPLTNLYLFSLLCSCFVFFSCARILGFCFVLFYIFRTCNITSL